MAFCRRRSSARTATVGAACNEREARSYVKRKASYWDEDIKESRQKRKSGHSDQQSSEVHNQQPSAQSSTDAPTTGNTQFSDMTVRQLKDELRQRNAEGFNKKNKAELLKQLEEISQGENVSMNTNLN